MIFLGETISFSGWKLSIAPERRYRLTVKRRGCGELLKKLGGGKDIAVTEDRSPRAKEDRGMSKGPGENQFLLTSAFSLHKVY